MRKKYNYVTTNPTVKVEFHKYLERNIDRKYWDISEYYDGWYFGLELTEVEAEAATWFLDGLFDTL